jgi:hypothetical protein
MSAAPSHDFDEMEAALRERLEGLPPAARSELVHVLMLPDFERADRIGEFWGNLKTDVLAELPRPMGTQGCPCPRAQVPPISS